MPTVHRLLRPTSLLILLVVAACAETRPGATPSPGVGSTLASPTQRSEGIDTSVSSESTLFTPQQLQEDLLVLRTTLEEAHPGLYTYANKATRDAQFDAVLERLDHEMSDIAFYRLIAPLIVSIRDGHTAVWPAADSVVYTGQNATFLPFTLRFIEKRAFVDAVYSPIAGVTPRTEVLSINGLGMADIVAQLLPYVPHDGLTETGQAFLLGRTFPITYGFAFEQVDDYVLSVRDHRTGEARAIAIPGLNPVELASFFQELTNLAENLELQILEEDGIAIMTIGSFGNPDIAEFLADSFERLNKLEITELIIDLRGNSGGGNHPGGLLYPYLVNEPFRYYDQLTIVLDAPLTYMQHTDLSPSRLNEILARTVLTDDGERHYPHWYGFDQMLQNEPHPYTGRVYVLIDGGSGSSTSEFAAIAHHNGRAVFIGEETGGTYLSNNSGEMPTLTLPNTGIKVIVPLFQFVMAVSDPPFGRGVIPDHPIIPTVEQFLGGIDSQLEFALALIRDGEITQKATP